MERQQLVVDQRVSRERIEDLRNNIDLAVDHLTDIMRIELGTEPLPRVNFESATTTDPMPQISSLS
jgi:hypothetical protein